MKRLIILFFLFPAWWLSAQSPDSLFRKANDSYQHGNYEEAINLYLKVDSLGFHSADLYYNAGNAYFRSNKLGRARLYFEKALLLKPNDEDIKSNLSFTESMLTDRFDEVPALFFVRWYKKLVAALHASTWTNMSLILFTISFAGFLVYIFSRKTRFRRSGFYTGLTLIIFSAICLYFGIQRDRQVNHPGTAIIINSSQTVKSAPRESGKDLFVLHEGTKVRVNNSLDGWKEITISDGRKGWVPISTLADI